MKKQKNGPKFTKEGYKAIFQSVEKAYAFIEEKATGIRLLDPEKKQYNISYVNNSIAAMRSWRMPRRNAC
jgi:hypothetical protein